MQGCCVMKNKDKGYGNNMDINIKRWYQQSYITLYTSLDRNNKDSGV